MNWWLEYRSIKQGWYFTGTYQEAVQAAQAACVTESTLVDVYDGGNRRVAEVTRQGAARTFPALQGSSCPD